MALIDRSYFIGELNIPNTNRTEIQERLDWFIEKHEQQLLRDLFGYPLYKAFKAGLQGAPVDQKWTDLLQGVEYTNQSGILDTWRGLVSLPLDLINAMDASGRITIIVGRGQQYDPVPDTNTVLLPPSLIGKDFIVEQRAVGDLRSDEWSIINGNTLKLSSGQFAINDTYFYKSATLALNTVTGSAKQSLIANYVYYQWQQDQVTQTVGLGEAATKAENAVMVSPANKMINAWNEMVEWIKEMVCFLDSNLSDYPEWQDQNRCPIWKKFWNNNQFGI